MSVYKVPQNVEAEDKLVGPFTLKQFIFLIVAAISGFVTFQLIQINIFLIILTLPITIVSLILGIYRRDDQPVEVYLQSLLRFYLKPRLRIWDQDGIMEPVKVTAPPKVIHHYTDGRTKSEVSGQLRSLANIMDTRGWASKSTSLQYPMQQVSSSDRLIDVSELPNYRQASEIHEYEDMLYTVSPTPSPVPAGNYAAAPQGYTQQATYQSQQAAATYSQPQPYGNPNNTIQSVLGQSPSATEATPTLTTQAQPEPVETSGGKNPAQAEASRLAHEDNLSVKTISKQMKKASKKEDEIDGEGEISLR